MEIKYRIKKVTSSVTKEVKFIVQWKSFLFWNTFLKCDNFPNVEKRLFEKIEDAELFKKEVMILNQSWD